MLVFVEAVEAGLRLEEVLVPKKGKKWASVKGVSRSRSTATGRFEKARPDAEEFSRQFNKKYRSTLRDLSKR